MTNARKMLENQQKINEAVKHILDYFGGEVPYTVHVEQMLDAQTQIIGLMDLAKTQMLIDPDSELEFTTNEIPMFLRDVRNYLKMLKPFVELLGQAGFGNENQ